MLSYVSATTTTHTATTTRRPDGASETAISTRLTRSGNVRPERKRTHHEEHQNHAHPAKKRKASVPERYDEPVRTGRAVGVPAPKEPAMVKAIREAKEASEVKEAKQAQTSREPALVKAIREAKETKQANKAQPGVSDEYPARIRGQLRRGVRRR